MTDAIGTAPPASVHRADGCAGAVALLVVIAGIGAGCPAPAPGVCTARIHVVQPAVKPLAEEGDEAVVVVKRGDVELLHETIDLAGKGQSGGDVVAVAPEAAVPRGRDLTLHLSVFTSVGAAHVVAQGRARFDCDNDGAVDVPLYLGPANAFAALSSPRSLDGATATALDDGRVLLVGGTASSTSPALLFDPRADDGGAFTAVDGVAARVGHTATKLADGRVVVVGGLAPDSAAFVDGIAVFDPTAATFTEIASSLAVAHHGAALVDDGRSILVAGGGDLDAGAFVKAYLVDGDGGVVDTAPLSAARAFAATIALPSGKVLVAGGADANGALLDSLELYDEASKTWGAPVHECPTAPAAENLCAKRARAAAVLLDDGNALITGGDVVALDGAVDPPPDSEVFLIDEERMLPAAAPADVVATVAGVDAARIACGAPPCPTLVAGAGTQHRLFSIASASPSLTDHFYAGRFVDGTRAENAPAAAAAALVSLDDGTVLAVDGAGAARFTFCEEDTDDIACPAP